MSVLTDTSRWEYSGDNVSVAFGYNNWIYAATDLKVYVNGVLKVLNTDYTVTGIGLPTGGNVVFLAAPPVPTVVGAKNVIIDRDMPRTQQTQYPANDKFPSALHERALDKLTILVQQLYTRLARAILLDPAISFDGQIVLPQPEEGKFLIWGEDGEIRNYDVGVIGGVALPLSVTLGGTNATNASDARSNLGLGELATLDLSDLPAPPASGLTLPVFAKTANYALQVSDKGHEINFTTAGVTCTFLAAATAGDGYVVVIRNSAPTGSVTFAGANVDGLAGRALAPGDAVLVRSDGAAYMSGFGDYSYDSGEQTITAGGLLTLAHNLKRQPYFVEIIARCKTAEANFAVNDEVVLAVCNYAGLAVNKAVNLRVDATNLRVRIGSSGLAYSDASSGAEVTLTAGNWRLILRARAK